MLAQLLKAMFQANPEFSMEDAFNMTEVRMDSTDRPFKNRKDRSYHKKSIREIYENEYGSGTISQNTDELSEVIKSFLNHSF